MHTPEIVRKAAARLIATCITAAATLTTGCDQRDADTPFEHYVERLERTLATDAVPLNGTPLQRPPRSGALRLQLEASTLGPLDFLALSGCELQVNIGKRNSSLGRMARDSQRLLLDLEFLQLAPPCIEQIRADDRNALADSLQRAAQQKRQQLPAMIFNATLGAEEFRAFWLPTRQMGEYPFVGDSSVVTSLGAINAMTRRWLSGDYSANNQDFELALADIAGGGGGALMQALLRQQDWLSVANSMLQQRMQTGPLCGPQFRHRAADILPNVVRRFFIDGIQPNAAVMENRRYALYSQVTALEQQIGSALPANYRSWQQWRDTALHNASEAPRRHVGLLKKIQDPCGGIAGNRPTP